MWQQTYTPLAGSLAVSALVASLPIFVLLYLLGVRRTASWMAALAGLGAAILVALLVYRMPFASMAEPWPMARPSACSRSAGWSSAAILLYRITVEPANSKSSRTRSGSLTDDRRLQALLIAFAFGAFIEGAAGFGTPVAVAAAMLTGLGFSPFYAAGICLLANTAPVAFGSIGIPDPDAGRDHGPAARSSSARAVGRICAPISLIVPATSIVVMGGWKALAGRAAGRAAVRRLASPATQFLVSNFIGPQLTDILSSLAAIGSLVVLLQFWQPKDRFTLEGHQADQSPEAAPVRADIAAGLGAVRPAGAARAVLGTVQGVRTVLNRATLRSRGRACTTQVAQCARWCRKPSPYARSTRFELAVGLRDRPACSPASCRCSRCG